MSKEVLGGNVICLLRHPREEVLDGHCDCHSENHAEEALVEGRVDPLQGREVENGVGPSEDHPDQHIDDSRLKHRLVQSQVVVRVLLEVVQAAVLLAVRVHDPVLRHTPAVIRRIVVHDEEHDEANAEEEEVKFAGPATSNAEASAQRVPVHLCVKDETGNKEHKAEQLPNDELV